MRRRLAAAETKEADATVRYQELERAMRKALAQHTAVLDRLEEQLADEPRAKVGSCGGVELDELQTIARRLRLQVRVHVGHGLVAVQVRESDFRPEERQQAAVVGVAGRAALLARDLPFCLLRLLCGRHGVLVVLLVVVLLLLVVLVLPGSSRAGE